MSARRGAIGAALLLIAVVQILTLRDSWFFLDDVPALHEARTEGLTLSYLESSVGRHFLPGHKVFDWLVSVPFGVSWTFATLLLTASMVAGCAYLAAALGRAFGPSWRQAIPVALAGTAWVMIAGAQWFSAGAGAYPSFACLCGALYHHLRWRQGDGRGHGAAALGLTLLALFFWVQAAVAPVLLLGIVLSARAYPARWSRRDLTREVVAVLPCALVVVLHTAYASTRPGLESAGGRPPLADVVELARVVALRGLLPSLSGTGLPGGPLTPHEQRLQLIAALVLAAGLAAGFLLRTRWVVAAGWFVLGVLLCTVTIGAGRLSELGAADAGTTPRYLMVGVLCGAIGVGALLTASGRGARVRLMTGSPQRRGAAAVVAAAALALYLVSLQQTYDRSTLSRDRGQAAKAYFTSLEDGLGGLDRAQAASVVSGTVPGSVYYPPPDPSSDLRRVIGFLGRDMPALAGEPQPGGTVLTVDGNGVLVPARLRPVARSVCAGATCEVVNPPGTPGPSALYVEAALASPAPRGAHVVVTAEGGTPGVPGPHRVRVPAGARRLTLPVQAAAGAEPLRVQVRGIGVTPARLRLGTLEQT